MTHSTTTLDLEPAARQLKTLLSGVSDEQLTARTPCETYTVADLLHHLMGLTIGFRMAATKSTGPSEDDGSGPATPGDASAANLDPDWRRQLPSQLDELVAAWRDPAAWTGTTEAGGVTMPADVIGVFAVDELVIHGWDLARATEQPFESEPRTTAAIFALLSSAADGEGQEGPFGPVVDVAADAPLLHRVLGLTGRDPSWTP